MNKGSIRWSDSGKALRSVLSVTVFVGPRADPRIHLRAVHSEDIIGRKNFWRGAGYQNEQRGKEGKEKL
jgi:hypothetical protein